MRISDWSSDVCSSDLDEIQLDKKYAERTWVFKDQNNSSRLGFKGDQDVGVADLKVIYQLEYGIDPDGSEGAPFSERNIFVGLKGGFGAVQFGKYDTPVKNAGAKTDLFNDQSIGDIGSLDRKTHVCTPVTNAQL